MVRRATPDDFPAVGQLLFDFNTEYEEETPPAERLARRIPALTDAAILIAGDPPHGLSVMRFRPAIWTTGLECYLAELYVRPEHRGQGDGRALLRASFELARERGADWIDLNTEEDDTAARMLYAAEGLEHTGLYYERDL